MVADQAIDGKIPVGVGQVTQPTDICCLADLSKPFNLAGLSTESEDAPADLEGLGEGRAGLLPVAAGAVGAAGGVHVRLSPYDPRVVDIRFMDGDGLNLDKAAEREIEKAFLRS